MKIETIGKSDEDRELAVVWVSSDANIKNLQVNRDNLARIADPRGLTPEQARTLIATTKPQYHLMGGLHSGETGPSEMLMELTYRLVTETSPLIKQIRDNVIVSVTPVADPDGRDRNVDWFYKGLENAPAAGTGGGGGRGGAGLRTWGKYLPRRTSGHQSLTGVDARARGLLLHRASRRSCTTCTRRSRCSIPIAAAHRRIPTWTRFSSPSFRFSPTSNSRR